MENIISGGLEVLKGAWPVIQPAISGVFGAIVYKLFLRGDTATAEFEKLKQAQFADVAKKLLDDGHISHLEYYKCRNFTKIAQKADEVYRQQSSDDAKNIDNQNHTEETSQKLSFDWFVRFFEEAGNISDEQVQDLWAKVLAGEIRHPGTFSLRFVDTLRNLSKEDGETIQTLASYAIKLDKNFYLCTEEVLQEKYGYHDKLLTMYDYDIIAENVADSYSLSTKGEGMFMRIGSLNCYSHNQISESFSLTMQRFTKIGNEFIRLVKPNEQYLIDLFRIINNKYPNLKLTVHRGGVINGTSLSIAPDLLSQEETKESQQS